MAGMAIGDLQCHLTQLESTVREYDRRIAEIAAQSELARRLMTRPGIGKLTAYSTRW
jgi:transposase